MKHSTRIKVRGYHCDFYGHVNNARYLELFEEARWRYLEEGLDLGYWKERHMGFVVVAVTLNFRRPAGLNTPLLINSSIDRLGGRSGIIRQEMLNEETGKTIADAELTFAVIDLRTGKALPMEGEVKEGLKKVAAGHAEGSQDHD